MSAPALTLPATLRAAAPHVVVPVGAFLAGAAPVAVLGFDNGGYDVQGVAGLGVILWWLLLVGILSGALPRPAPTVAGGIVLVAVGLLAVWGAVTLGWSASDERGLTEVVRLVVYGGALLLGSVAVSAGQSRTLVAGVLCGLVLLVGAGVLSRLQPDLFPGSSAVADYLGERRRLSWPLNYWNGMGAVAGLALPLCLSVAARARTATGSACAAAATPVVALGLVLTLSRGGTIAAAIGLLVCVFAVSPRLVVLRTALAPIIGSGIVIVATLHNHAIREAVGGATQTDAGRELLPLILLVVVGVGFAQAGWHLADRAQWTRKAPRPSTTAGRGFGALAVIVIIIAVLAADVPGRVSDGWRSFKQPDFSALRAQSGSVQRLTAANGTGRYEEWSNAIDALRANPLGGIGLGSWEAWFSPRRVTSPPVRNAHSEPLELAAETGIPGAALFFAIVLTPIFAVVTMLIRRRRTIPDAAVVLPTLVGFVVVTGVDWSWQLSSIPVAVALLGATVLGRDRSGPVPIRLTTGAPVEATRQWTAALPGVGIAVVAVASISVLAVSMIAPRGVERSQAAAAGGSLSQAADTAAKTGRAAPFSLAAATQQALVAEKEGDLDAAATAAQEGTRIEPRNWRPWIVLARIEAERGRAKQAVAAYRRARALNPRSPLLKP